MNNLYVDLHGLTEQEAVAEIMTGLISFETAYEDEMEFITGRGQVLTGVLEDILIENGYSWTHRNNNYGSYIIKK